jgi:hypothetical protein
MAKTRKLIFYSLFIIFLGCNKEQSSDKIADELRGNIFELTSSIEYVKARTIEFKDSTYTIYEDGIQNLKWYAPILSRGVLVLDGKKIDVQKVNDSVFDWKIDSDTGKTINFKLIRKNPNWSEKHLTGTWMMERDYNIKQFYKNDKIEMVLPIIKTPKGLDTTYFEPHPIFKIQDNKLTYKKFYNSIVSKFKVIKNERYMALDLENSKMMKAKYFKIMSQKDSILYVDLTDKVTKSNDSTQLGFIKFIKIR